MTDPLARLTAALADRYRIERELGQGGMATVYLAQDLKHDRRVAIKVLRPELAAVIGAERFVREIRTIAALQHPHILGLIDSGMVESPKSKVEGEGSSTFDFRLSTFVYYVMPYVDGESLRDRLNREKQLPVGDAVRLAAEVAGALDYAHRHGVIHRDIKPENILLHDGRALVADFGIALAVSSAGGSRMTETGMSLGTPHYMSPEQAMGEREITARSDVYALGCVTYEMLVGEPPFTGPTAQAIVAKVMTAEPTPLIGQRKSIPAEVESAVLTALEKLPADRFGTAAEFGQALCGTGRAVRRAAHPSARPTAVYAALALVAALAAWGWLRAGEVQSDGTPSRLTVPAPSGGFALGALMHIVDISADGRTIAYIGNDSGSTRQIFIRQIDQLEPRRLGVRALGLGLKPSAGELVYLDGTQGLLRQSLSGGAPSLTPSGFTIGFLAWDRAGNIWISNTGYGVKRISAQGRVDSVFSADSLASVQQVLPGDKLGMGIDATGSASGSLVVIELATGRKTPVDVGPVAESRYAQGVLVFSKLDGTLQAVRFNPSTGKTEGSPVEVANSVAQSAGITQFALADNGTLIYLPEVPQALVLVDRQGQVTKLLAEGPRYHSPRFSPDGARIALDASSNTGRDVWVLERQLGTLSRLTFVGDGHDPFWVPGGRGIAFASQQGGMYSVLRSRTDGKVDTLVRARDLAFSGSPLPDGKSFVTVVQSTDIGSGSDVVQVDSAGKISPLVATRFDEGWPAVSPDGQWLAFVSNLSGRQEVYVRPLGRDGEQIQVSSEGGNEPVWSRDQREIFYRGRTSDGTALVTASVRTSPSFQVTGRTTLFSVDSYDPGQPHANYDVSPNGRSFVLVKRSPASHLVVVQNLRALVGSLQSRQAAP